MFASHADYAALEDRARRVLDPAVFDFYAGGSGDEGREKNCSKEAVQLVAR